MSLSSVHLKALDEVWESSVGVAGTASTLFLAGQTCQYSYSLGINPAQELHLITMLDWLKVHTYKSFTIRIDRLCNQFGFKYNKLVIRVQKTLWGSCTASGTISLNAKLAFLPVELLEAVMLHELCHTRVLNHSARFWAEVASCDPGYQQHNKALRQGEHYVPGWVDMAVAAAATYSH